MDNEIMSNEVINYHLQDILIYLTQAETYLIKDSPVPCFIQLSNAIRDLKELKSKISYFQSNAK